MEAEVEPVTGEHGWAEIEPAGLLGPVVYEDDGSQTPGDAWAMELLARIEQLEAANAELYQDNLDLIGQVEVKTKRIEELERLVDKLS